MAHAEYEDCTVNNDGFYTNNACYVMKWLDTLKLNWTDAWDKCAEHGMLLAPVADNQQLMNQLIAFANAKVFKFCVHWILSSG